jgi:hypothetical protein
MNDQTVNLLYNSGLYTNYLKNREFGKEVPQIFRLERAAFVRDKDSSENGKCEIKPTPPKTDSSGSLCITPKQELIAKHNQQPRVL